MEIIDIYFAVLVLFFIGLFLWWSISKPKEQKQLLTKLIEFSNNKKNIFFDEQ